MNTCGYRTLKYGSQTTIEDSMRRIAATLSSRRNLSAITISCPELAPSIGTRVTENVRVADQPESSGSQVRPWTRYFARCIDLWLFSIMVGIAAAFFAPSILNVPEVLLTAGILFAWIFQESILLANCGTTPGKWLFKIKVRDCGGRNLKFSDALNRSFSVWSKGMGAGIPVFTLFTQLSSKSKLKRDGVTPWDEEGQYVVTHQRIGVIRSIVIAVIIGAFLCFLASV